jgi:hypothetical protein
MHRSAQEAQVFEAIEADLERCRVAPAHGATELVEAERAVQERTDDVHRPLLLQYLYRFVNRAIRLFSIHLVVPPSQTGY